MACEEAEQLLSELRTELQPILDSLQEYKGARFFPEPGSKHWSLLEEQTRLMDRMALIEVYGVAGKTMKMNDFGPVDNADNNDEDNDDNSDDTNDQYWEEAGRPGGGFLEGSSVEEFLNECNDHAAVNAFLEYSSRNARTARAPLMDY